MKPWEEALNHFLSGWRERKDVTGALVCGSYVTGHPSKRSDIDLHIILSDHADWRERGNRYVNGFLIEYFANPPKQIRKYFLEDHGDRRTMSMVQFMTGNIVFDDDGTLHRLVEEALEWKRKPFPSQDSPSKEIMKYGLWDRLDNVLDCYEHGRDDFHFVYHHSLLLLFHDYCAWLHVEQTPYYQISQYLVEPEYLTKYLKSAFPDAEFGKLFQAAMECHDRSLMVEMYQNMTNHVLRKMEGFHIDGWRVRTAVE